jgi:hypothetical protein
MKSIVVICMIIAALLFVFSVTHYNKPVMVSHPERIYTEEQMEHSISLVEQAIKAGEYWKTEAEKCKETNGKKNAKRN